MSPSAARDAALRKFGNVTAARERFYHSSRIMWLENLRKDAGYAVRTFRRHPGFAAVPLIVLSIAIGLNTSLVTVIVGAMLSFWVRPVWRQAMCSRDERRASTPSWRSGTNKAPRHPHSVPEGDTIRGRNTPIPEVPMRRRLACAILALALVAPVSAQLENVGNLSFPTSGSPAAQQHFLRGVAILHSFGWKQAIAEFKLAQKAQPDFAMAYWGETLCYNHPLMAEQDPKNPRAVLARLGPTTEARLAKAPTAREKGFLGAVEALWGEGDFRKRRLAYMDAMERLHKQFPKDDEVTTFYALSLLSGARALDDNTFRYEVKAGGLAMDVVKHNPKHPGATHYIIHAFDDPVHAPLALEAARMYAEIVPAVSHAVHMPTHIFIQHGMWNEVANQNVRAFQIAKDLWEPGDVPGDMSHSGDWGQYGFLQLGDYAGARTRMDVFAQMAEMTKNPRATSALALQKARYIIETEEWKVQPMPENASNETLLANGMSAVKTGDLATAEKMEAQLAAKAGSAPGETAGGAHADHAPAPAPAAAAAPGGPDAGKSVRIMHRELKALIALAKNQNDAAVTLLKEAVTIEESMRPPNGAADPVKPSHELLGEVLLQVGKAADAAAAFDTGLIRMPNRARSLIGSARAHAAAGHRDIAAERYATLNSFWKGKPFTNPSTELR